MANYTSKFTGAEIDAALTKAQACKVITAATVNASGHLVLTFSDGTTLDAGTAKGDKGDTGATGATGAAGVSTVETPTYAENLNWLEANGDASEIYILPDGYLYAKIASGAADFTNLFDPDTAVMNKLREGTNGAMLTDSNGLVSSALIPISCRTGKSNPTKIRIRGVSLLSYQHDQDRITYYGEDGTQKWYCPIRAGKYETDGNGDIVIYAGWSTTEPVSNCDVNYKYFSFSGFVKGEEGTAITSADIADIIITVDEEITYSTAPKWASTGIQYANYALTDTDRQMIAELIGNTSPLTGKKVLVLGDSISTDVYGRYTKWVTVLMNSGFLPSDTVNSSRHATGFVARYTGDDANAKNDFIDRVKEISDKDAYDLVVVFGGINDFIQSIPMGGGTGETDTDTYFKPAVDYFFAYLLDNFTQARIVVLSPLMTQNTGKNTAGYYQTDYADYIRATAKAYCLPVLNLTEESGFCPFTEAFRGKWTLIPSGYTEPDGVHPNEAYQKDFLAPMIEGFLRRLYGRGV